MNEYHTTGAQQWGQFDPAADRVRIYKRKRAGAEDLLDFAAVQTLLNGGVVCAVEPERMPADSQLAAVMRH